MLCAFSAGVGVHTSFSPTARTLHPDWVRECLNDIWHRRACGPVLVTGRPVQTRPALGMPPGIFWTVGHVFRPQCHAAAWNETAIPSQINGIDAAAKMRKCCLERELASFAAVELRISSLYVAATLAQARAGPGYRDPPGRRIWPPRILIYCGIIEKPQAPPFSLQKAVPARTGAILHPSGNVTAYQAPGARPGGLRRVKSRRPVRSSPVSC
jgi:hypothetical protein